jgi:hypothetical protein
MDNFGKCECSVPHRRIVLREKLSKITFLNNAELPIRKIKIDGCVINNDEIRCDYVIIRELNEEIYIELKGSDVPHALKQIINTINLISDNVKLIKKLCFVVTMSCPLTSTEIQKQKLFFKNKFNSSLDIKHSHCEFTLS